MSYDDCWSFMFIMETFKSFSDGIKVMTVTFCHIETESFKLFFYAESVHDIFNIAVDL